MARSRNYCFTHNNYPDTSLEDGIDCRYIVYGKEVGASGTPHLQGLISFGSLKSLTQVIKLLPGCHVEVCKALIASIAYCKKEGEFTERGTPPMDQKTKGEVGGDAEEERWRGIRLAAEEGNLDLIPEKIRFNSPHLIEHHRKQGSLKRKLEDTTSQNLWYWGASGTGKSRKAREDHPDAYLKMCNKWWDGFDSHSTVLLEDFDKKHDVLCHHLKIWGDRYPFLAECKGTAIKIRPDLLIVTSNYHPREIWTDPSDLEPIMRRFKTVEFKIIKSQGGAPTGKHEP